MINLILDDLKRVDERLKETVHSEFDLISRISLGAIEGGKRLRPSLLILWTRGTAQRELDPQEESRMIDLAATVELIHVASLVHDDIVDGSTIRRGKPTVNFRWNTRIALLEGDYLLARAMNLAAKSASRAQMRLITRCLRRMCEGEIMQTWACGEIDLTLDRYLDFISMKTASLMESSCMLGTMISGAKHLHRSARIYGLHFGMAFQIVDDVRDLIGTDLSLGKEVHNDLLQRRFTAPIIYLREICDEEDRKELMKKLRGDLSGEDLHWVIRLARNYGVVERCHEMIRRLLSVAISALDRFPEGEPKYALEAVTMKLEEMIKDETST